MAPETPLQQRLPPALGQFTPVVAVAAVILESATDFFPDDPLISVVTPLRLIMLGGLAALVASGARLHHFRTRMDLPLGVLLLFAAGITIAGGHPTAPLRGLLTDIAGFYLIVGLRRAQPESWRAVGLLALVSVTAASTAAIEQITNDTPTGFCRSGLLGDAACEPGALVRATGTFANPNTLAAFLVLLAPLALLSARVVRDGGARLSILVLGVVAYSAVLTTFSRAGYLAAAAGLLVLAGATWFAPKVRRRRLHLTVGCAVAGLAVVTLVIGYLSRAGDALGVRGQAWAAAIDVAIANPLGVGLGNAGSVIGARAPGGEEFAHAHNLWLNWLLEAGIGGLLAITAVTVVGAVTAARLAREKSAAGAVGLAALTAFLLMSTLDHPANLSRISMLFWLVLGLVMAEAPTRWRALKQATAKQPPKSMPRPPVATVSEEDAPTELVPTEPPEHEWPTEVHELPEPSPAEETAPIPAWSGDPGITAPIPSFPLRRQPTLVGGPRLRRGQSLRRREPAGAHRRIDPGDHADDDGGKQPAR